MKVSVVIPCYNSSKYIIEAIESVLSQTSKALEIIVVDDGSTDGSGDLVASTFGDRVQLIRQENQGRVGARKTGIKAAQGDWVALLDADDLWKGNKLEEQLKVIEKASEDIVIVHTDFNLIGNLSCRNLCLHKMREIISLDYYFQGNTFHTSSILLRKNILDLVLDYWNLGRFRAQDYGLFILMLCHGNALYVNSILCYYRIHDENNHDEYEFEIGLIKSRENVINYLVSIDKINLLKCCWKKILSNSYFDAGWYMYIGYNYDSASKLFCKSFFYDKSNIKSFLYCCFLRFPKYIVNFMRRTFMSKSFNSK